MKKIPKSGMILSWIPKLDLKMKLSILLLFSSVFVLQANNTYGQKKKVSLDMNNVTIAEIIDEIETNTEFKFFFNTKVVDLNRVVSIRVKKVRVHEILNQLFFDVNTSYEIDDRKILLFKNEVDDSTKKMKPDDETEDFQQEIKGIVTNPNGDPSPGANIIEKGTSNGTQSDFDGKFSITVSDKDAILVVSYIGFLTKEIALNGQTTIAVTLQEDAALLDEVVVVGYGTQKKGDLTGAVSSLKEKDFNPGIVASPEQLIQGRVAGVQITSSSGEPGAGISIRIRGAGSIRSGNNPLFVVDGVPLSGDNINPEGTDGGTGGGSRAARNPLNFLNPNDISSIDILKDASATAIYGSRGSNGVVIITTKKGSGKATLDYSYSIGISNITEKYDVLNAQEFTDLYTQIGGTADLNFGGNTDWQDEVLRTAITQTHQFSYGGGTESGNHRFSLSYSDQEGIIKQSGLKRLTGRFNGSQSILDGRVKVSTQMAVSNIDNDHGDPMSAAIVANPTWPLRNPDGSTFQSTNPFDVSPVAFLELTRDFSNTLKYIGNISVDIKITDWLSFKTIYGLDRSFSTRKNATSNEFFVSNDQNGSAIISNIQAKNTLWENYFNIEKELTKNINLSAQIGYSYQKFEREGHSLRAQDFRTADLDIMLNNITSASLSAANDSFRTIDELQSYFSRFNLNFNDKYLLTGTVRVDGSTKFGEDNVYGIFPSVAFKWKIFKESFMPAGFSDLSLRTGWGITGNQEIPHDLFTRRQRFGNPRFDTPNGTVVPGDLQTVAFENNQLKWEETDQFNIGLDFGFMKNRLRGSINYYYKSTTDLLLRLGAAEPAPQEFVWQNLDAKVINKGFEVELETDVVQNSNFDWTIAANATFNDNTLKDFAFGFINTGNTSGGPGLSDTFVQRIQSGYPLNSFYMQEFLGFDSNGIAEYGEEAFTGDSALPTTIVGLTNTFRYKNFDLNIFFSGQFGHSIYNSSANSFFSIPNLSQGRNITRDVAASGESVDNPVAVSTRYLEKGDYVRLQNFSLGYRVNTGENSLLSSLRFSLTGQNLFTITDYSGQDPEVNTDRAINGVPSFGIDNSSYPRARTFLLGVNANF
ncbi:TonB-dependent receptor [Flavivirga eckloniae]|uniref:SusC/RagA family TonB-linked outer membrane protein n=1 Tax=Flavivirga eckloniae TaxID=1803846 RepID=A0A2K9PW16_9FLAO|nr:TonB-dependent receptor [Flavivirga eckloniae]AUP81256.1 SusC/RagA family TonB-linked outer membrane protein [Flavivirga eckloniae]